MRKVEYKSGEMDGLSGLEQCAYFWNERHDPSRYVGYESVIKKHPRLKSAWEFYQEDIEQAENTFSERLQQLVDEHDPSEVIA